MDQLLSATAIEALATDFAEETRFEPGNAETLKGAIDATNRVRVRKVKKLTVEKVQERLSRSQIDIELTYKADIEGFLIVVGGDALIFLDPDPPERFQFNLAHEIAHYLIEYHHPASRVQRGLGMEALQMKNGEVALSIEMRIKAFLMKINIQPFTHLLDLSGLSARDRIRVSNAEINADRLAFELLAPFQQVKPVVMAKRYGDVVNKAEKLLRAHYGFPDIEAGLYAEWIGSRITGGRTMEERLGFC